MDRNIYKCAVKAVDVFGKTVECNILYGYNCSVKVRDLNCELALPATTVDKSGNKRKSPGRSSFST